MTSIEHGSTDAFYNPLPADYLFFPTYDVPNVALVVNGVSGACSDVSVNRSRCGFSYKASITPQVTGISTAHPTQVLYGDAFTIVGSGFGSNTTLVSVALGEGSCLVTSVTDTQIVCLADHTPTGTFAVTVLHANYGLATIAAGVANSFIYSHYVASVWPTSGAPEGGNLLFLTGTGFGAPASLNI